MENKTRDLNLYTKDIFRRKIPFMVFGGKGHFSRLVVDDGIQSRIRDALGLPKFMKKTVYTTIDGVEYKVF